MSIRVAVVDAHPLTRYGIAELIAGQPDIELVDEAGSVAEAWRCVAMSRPDVVTVAVALPDGDGLQLARQLRDRHPDLGIVVLTTLGEDDVLFRAMETGASAFVAKSAPLSEILGAIRHAAVAASSFTAAGLAGALNRRDQAASGLALSPREREVLGLLGDGKSVPAIAAEMYLSVSTAKTYVARLYDKLGASNRAQALMTALRHGLLRYDSEQEPGDAPVRRGRTVPRPA